MYLSVCVCREAEPLECHLKDMLQQLNSIIAAKPAEKAIIRQGERRLPSLVERSFWFQCLVS